MIKRLVAILVIFAGTSAAWIFLGNTIETRTKGSGERLRDRVQSIWGSPQTQAAPGAEYDPAMRVAPSSSDISVDLKLEPRRKGLLWYSTYKVTFQGDYQFTNTSGAQQRFKLALDLPAAEALYDDLQVLVDGQAVQPVIEKTRAWAPAEVAAGQSVQFRVRYQSQGLEAWRYSFGKDVNAVMNFHMRMSTDFKDIDFPDNTLAPGAKQETATGWILDWNYKSLLSGYQVALSMPEKLQPGPLASQISYFAPVSLFFFFFVLFLISTLRSIDLHPMNYFFIAGAFFAFHLLLAYLVDHVDIRLAFVISSLVSVFLVVTYLRMVVGTEFAIREAGIAQFLYLVLFSFAFFFKGFTGLAVTFGSIITLFIVMQMTGRVRWSEKFEEAVL